MGTGTKFNVDPLPPDCLLVEGVYVPAISGTMQAFDHIQMKLGSSYRRDYRIIVEV
jgi:hypothetical protein